MTEQEWLAARDPGAMLTALRPGYGDVGLIHPGRLGEVAYRASDRKLRLALAACCRRVWGSLGPRGRAAFSVAERFADGEASAPMLQVAAVLAGQEAAESQQFAPGNRVCLAAAWLCGDLAHPDQVLRACATAAASGPKGAPDDYDALDYAAERAAQCGLLRCVFGNPFLPATADPQPRWQQDAVAYAVALAAYEERPEGGLLDPVRLAVLADALEEAGCPGGDEVKRLSTALDGCWCDDGGRHEECGECVTNRALLAKAEDGAALLAHLRGPGPHVRGCWVLDLLLGKE